MRARQSAIIDTAHHVQAFLDANASLLGANILPARHNLDDAVAQLTSMAATQSGGVMAAKGATARQKALRATLRNNYMTPVSTVAKLLLSDVPEIGALQVKMKNLSTTQLVAAAHGMADAAEGYATVFTQNGLPDDFVAQLRNVADAVTASVAGRQATQAVTSGAVSGMLAQESRVRSLLRLINALVVPKLGTNATLLAQWKAARAISPKTPIGAVPSSVTEGIASSLPSGSSTVTGGTTPPASTTPTPASASPAATPTTSAAPSAASAPAAATSNPTTTPSSPTSTTSAPPSASPAAPPA
jgi:hypothetical protein